MIARQTSKAYLSRIIEILEKACLRYCKMDSKIQYYESKKSPSYIARRRIKSLTCCEMINRISIGRPISTQFASCKKPKRSHNDLGKLLKVAKAEILDKIVTNGKPLRNRPRLTTDTTGTTMMGVKILH